MVPAQRRLYTRPMTNLDALSFLSRTVHSRCVRGGSYYILLCLTRQLAKRLSRYQSIDDLHPFAMYQDFLDCSNPKLVDHMPERFLAGPAKYPRENVSLSCRLHRSTQRLPQSMSVETKGYHRARTTRYLLTTFQSPGRYNTH
jgi:hypothetical protein